MIARIWRGVVSADRAEEYLAYVNATGVPEYRATPGNRGVLVLQREEAERAEFVLISFWDSFDAIRAFAGEAVERARYYPKDHEFLLEMEATVRHFEVRGLVN
jgi:heme-degrading monooxygenase HmoA